MKKYILNLAIILILAFLVQTTWPEFTPSLIVCIIITLFFIALPLLLYFREYKPSSIAKAIRNGTLICLLGGCLFAMFFIVYTNLIDRKVNGTNLTQTSVSSTTIGRTINVQSIIDINTGVEPLSADANTLLYLVISPTCPHCKNALGILQENKSFYDSISQVMTIVPVFREETSIEEGKQMLTASNIHLPVYRAVDCKVINEISIVPTFILASKDRVASISVGGFGNVQDLKWIINDLIEKSSQSTASY